MPTNSTNWAKPTGVAEGTQSLYNAHINYNTHIFYNGTYSTGASPDTNWAKQTVNTTDWTQS